MSTKLLIECPFFVFAMRYTASERFQESPHPTCRTDWERTAVVNAIVDCAALIHKFNMHEGTITQYFPARKTPKQSDCDLYYGEYMEIDLKNLNPPPSALFNRSLSNMRPTDEITFFCANFSSTIFHFIIKLPINEFSHRSSFLSVFLCNSAVLPILPIICEHRFIGRSTQNFDKFA